MLTNSLRLIFSSVFFVCQQQSALPPAIVGVFFFFICVLQKTSSLAASATTRAGPTAYLMDAGGSGNDLLAGVTPIKPLPFSPSQFLNSPSLNLSFDVVLPASTPVRKHFQKVCVWRMCFVVVCVCICCCALVTIECEFWMRTEETEERPSSGSILSAFVILQGSHILFHSTPSNKNDSLCRVLKTNQ